MSKKKNIFLFDIIIIKIKYKYWLSFKKIKHFAVKNSKLIIFSKNIELNTYYLKKNSKSPQKKKISKMSCRAPRPLLHVDIYNIFMLMALILVRK